jgi:hypothetical protein
MAITIGEVEVEVAPTPAPQSPSGSPPGPQQQKVELSAALERIHERQERLKAD